MSAPLLSVLVTTYNHAGYVEEALESLRAQSSRDFEVIITDDASPDGTGDMIEAWLQRTQFPAQLIRNAKNRGICANRNTALARSSGRFLSSLSGDDAYHPERIERQLACFVQQPERVAAVYSDATVVDATGRSSGVPFIKPFFEHELPPSGRLFERLVRCNFLCAPAIMLRRSAIAAVGGYDEQLSYEDFDMWLRLSNRFDFVYLPGELVRYRSLPSSMSHSLAGQAKMRESQTKILRKWLGAGLDRETETAILDALWAHGKKQLFWRRHAAAREAFAIAATRDPRLQRRLLAQLVQLPFAPEALRELALLARRLRGRAAIDESPDPFPGQPA